MFTYKKNRLIFFTFLIILNIYSCISPNSKKSQKEKNQWVYIELITESKTDTTEYFYFGQINKSLVDKIDSNERRRGLFALKNIRYWNDNDLLELYEDEKLEGDLIFKLEHIKEVVLYKDDPINLFELNELHESAKKLRTK